MKPKRGQSRQCIQKSSSWLLADGDLTTTLLIFCETLGAQQGIVKGPKELGGGRAKNKCPLCCLRMLWCTLASECPL